MLTGMQRGWNDRNSTRRDRCQNTRILEETEARVDALKGHVSEDYLARMKVGLQYWIDGGQKGDLAWGIFVFRKR